MASLRVTNGPSTGQQVQVETELLVGREGVDLVIDDLEMSRRHAAVRAVAGAIEVEDLGSSNGTFVNGERISEPTRVNGGEHVRCGNTVFEVLGVVPAQKPRISTIADPQATRARPVADPQATRVRPVVRDRGQPASPPGAALQSAARGAPLAAPVGTFSPPARPRSRGLASRSWVPAALSFGTVVIVAVALVIYFASR